MTLYISCLYLMKKSLKKYKKSFSLFLAVSCFLTRNVRLFFVPLSTITIFWFLFLFLLKYKKYKTKAKRFPWNVPMLFWGTSIVLTSIFSISGFSSEITTMLGNLLKDIFLIIVLWSVIDTKEDFFRLYRYLSIVFFISCIYGFIEYFMGCNPLQSYLANFAGISDAVVWSYSAEQYRGYRICSIFEHAMGAGVNWSLYAVFTIYLFIRRNKELKHKYFCMFTAIMCIVCVFLSKCRSPLLFLAFFSLSLVQIESKRFYKFLLFSAPVVIICAVVAYKYSSALQSIVDIVFFNGTGEMGIESSSLTLREVQIDTSFNLMKLSPLVGLGTHYKDVLSQSMTYYILGGEGILIFVPAGYGILGLIAYSIMAYYDIVFIPLKYKTKECFFLGLAYWITNMFSSIPGLITFIYYLFMIYFIRNTRGWNVNEYS
ncbi:O-antigen ligase family protein [Oliverpabstia intestinalis]|uniref:O-antigen ligase family protein n=1 Tax=Oliverpabstia intestinalis TaxID=2606633 RepID=UPI003F89C474